MNGWREKTHIHLPLISPSGSPVSPPDGVIKKKSNVTALTETQRIEATGTERPAS
jgi:hypothetical protein